MLLNNFYKNKRVLVTGNTGFKGSWLTAWLLKMGSRVYGYSIDIPSQPSLYEDLSLEKQITPKRGDINNHSTLQEWVQKCEPEIVFHLAAQPLVRRSYDNPIETFETNMMGTIKMMDCILKTPSVKASLMITTDKVYKNIESDYEYREDDPLGGKDPYSASKAAAEIAFKSYFESFFKESQKYIASVRAGNVIGGGDWSEDRLIPDAMRTWLNQKVLTIRSPHSVRPWQHVLEPLYGYLLLAKELHEGRHQGESYNFAPRSESHWSVEKVISVLAEGFEMAKWSVDSSQIGNKKESHLLQLSWEKAYKDLRWKPQLSMRETLEMTAEWYRNYKNNPKSVAKLTLEQIDVYEKICAKSNELNLDQGSKHV